VPTTVQDNAADHYETLRAAALGEELPVHSRRGLALFLRRGMWGWARWAQAAHIATTSQWPTPVAAASHGTDDEQRTMVRLFASMAITTTPWSAHA
jgi:hypothetical protein